MKIFGTILILAVSSAVQAREFVDQNDRYGPSSMPAPTDMPASADMALHLNTAPAVSIPPLPTGILPPPGVYPSGTGIRPPYPVANGSFPAYPTGSGSAYPVAIWVTGTAPSYLPTGTEKPILKESDRLKAYAKLRHFRPKD